MKDSSRRPSLSAIRYSPLFRWGNVCFCLLFLIFCTFKNSFAHTEPLGQGQQAPKPGITVDALNATGNAQESSPDLTPLTSLESFMNPSPLEIAAATPELSPRNDERGAPLQNALLSQVVQASVEAETMNAQGSYYQSSNGILLWGNGSIHTSSTQLADLESGVYQIEVLAFGVEDGNKPKMRIIADNRLIAEPVSVSNNNWQYQSYIFDNVELAGTGHSLSLDLAQPAGSADLWIDKIILHKTADILPSSKRAVLEAEQMNVQGGSFTSPSSVLLWSNGSISGQAAGLEAGVYDMEVVALGVEGDGDLPRMRVLAANRMAGDAVAVKNNGWNYQGYVFSGVELEGGTNDFRVQFFNDSPARDLWVDKIILRKTGELPYKGKRLITEAETMQAGGGNFKSPSAVRIWQNGSLQTTLTGYASGHYAIDLDAFGVEQNGIAPKVEVRVDGTLVGPAFNAANNDWNYQRIHAGELDLSGGDHTLTMTFAADSQVQDFWVDRVLLRKIGEITPSQNTQVFSIGLNNTILSAALNFGIAGIISATSTVKGWAPELSKLFLTGTQDVFDYLVFVPTLAAAQHLSLVTKDSTGSNDIGTFYLGGHNDTQGIGDPLYDYRASFGAQTGGSFDGMLYLDSGLSSGSDFRFSTSDFSQLRNKVLWENILSQEIQHRFSSYLTSNAGNPFKILGRELEHWGVFFDADFSPMDGNDWTDNGNGTFTLTQSYLDEAAIKRSTASMPYNDLDLYTMGALDASEVRVGFVIDNPHLADGRRLRPYLQYGENAAGGGPYVETETAAGSGIWSGPDSLYSGSVISGTKHPITLANIVNLEVPRSPAFPSTSRNFKPVFVVVSDSADTASITQTLTDKVRNFQNSFVDFFAQITRGLATLTLPAQNTSFARSANISAAGGTFAVFPGTQAALQTSPRNPLTSLFPFAKTPFYGDVFGKKVDQSPAPGKKKKTYRPWKKMVFPSSITHSNLQRKL